MRLGVSAGVRARDVGDELTGHRPGFDDGDADTEPLGDRSQELLEPFDGKLRPAVWVGERLPDHTADAGHGHHASAPGLAHQRQYQLGQGHHPDVVDYDVKRCSSSRISETPIRSRKPSKD